MQLACPSCGTAFIVDPGELGAAGRTVRCTRCRHLWFATADQLAESVAAGGTGAAAAAALTAPEGVNWDDTVVVDVEAPPLVPGLPVAPAVEPDRTVERARPSRRIPLRARSVGPRQAIAAAALAATFCLPLLARESVVRAVPQTAGFYAAIGLPVNLRGLAFAGVHGLRTEQDGTTILLIEGEIANVVAAPVELPRLRLAVLGAEQQELYAWTAMPTREVLQKGERLPFVSRLASPPADAQAVSVRFLTRDDLTGAGD